MLVDSHFLSPLQASITVYHYEIDKAEVEVKAVCVDSRNGEEESRGILGHSFNGPNE